MRWSECVTRASVLSSSGLPVFRRILRVSNAYTIEINLCSMKKCLVMVAADLRSYGENKKALGELMIVNTI